MNLSALILRHRKLIMFLFIAFAIIGGIVQFTVKVNYKMSDYLPDSAESTKAFDVMQEEFDDQVANARVLMPDVTIQEAVAIKEKIASVDGINDITWLDDIIDIRIPIEFLDESIVESHYKDEAALFTLVVEEGKEVTATNEIYEIIGDEGALAGEALDTAIAQELTGQETLYATLILVPVIIIILLLSTTSWVEPIFLLSAIGVSILINLGTNIFIGEVSFLSQSVAPILQLAVSLDYAIFLLHSFSDYRKIEPTVESAMIKAMNHSFTTIASSAATTFFGFMALTLMEFGIGADLGLSLVKGILFSFLSVMIFLPAFTVTFYHWIDKTTHKQFIPDKYSLGKLVIKLRIPVLLLIFLMILPSFLGQSETNFLYGMGEHPDGRRASDDTKQIEETFGKFTPVVILVPNGDLPREERLIADLKKLDHVKSIISYTETIGLAIPPEYLEPAQKENFFSENYSRIIVHTTHEQEGKEAFQFVEDVRKTVKKYYGDDYYATGENITLYDMKHVVEKDNTFVNTVTLVTFFIVLLLAFRSFFLPIVLLLTIQAAVWVNLAIPYFTNSNLVYLGYLIVSIVQLAATVDYAILFADNYVKKRKNMGKMKAIIETINEKIFSIAVPASILGSVGFILSFTSSDPIISSIGMLLGRGTVLAFLFVVFFLPALFALFDGIIKKTTWKANFDTKE